MSEASSSPEKLKMADDTPVPETDEHVQQQQQQDDIQQQDDSQQQVTQPEPELAGGAAVSGATEDTKQHEAQDVEMDDASAARHVEREGFEDGDDRGAGLQDATADGENGDEVGDAANAGAGDDDAEAAVDADAAVGTNDAAVEDAGNGNHTDAVEVVDDAETDDEENPTDGADDADADDRADGANASGDPKDANADVEASGDMNATAAETAGNEDTVDDVVSIESMGSTLEASTDNLVEIVEAGSTEDHNMQQEGSANAESAEVTEQQDPTNAQEQEQEASETEQHQHDEYDVADPSYDENAYDLDAQPMHAHDEYDPADTGLSSYERHGSDEYDPANPGGLEYDDYRSARHHGQEEYDPENPSYEREEYDPSSPSYSHASGGSEQDSPSKRTTNGQSSSKRKSTDSETASEHSHSTTERDLKRPRADSHDSTRSFDTKRPDDKKGLTDAAWDRLKDFQTLGEFRMNQVSRAAFASVGALPEFAQVSIIARFTRVPMKEVRDKNGQLMRIHHEYLKENRHVASLQPVSVFVDDYKSDPGLFDFGYAPPLPVHGISLVPVPYQREEPVDSRARSGSSASMTSPRQHLAPTPVAAAGTSHADPTPKPPTTDEFGRVINRLSAVSSSPSVSESSVDRPRATDPRRATQEKADESQRQASGSRVEGGLLSAGKPIDPRRRHGPGESEFVPRSVSGGELSPRAQPGDPRRRNVNTSAIPSQRVETNGLYDRLPGSVKAVLDKMIREGRLKEVINDNVISRLNHLPEHIALRAVENFNNVDLTHIDNLQGFLVGIINRVNEKSITPERSSTEPAPRANSYSTTPPAPSAAAAAASGYGGYEGGAVLANPTGANARHTGRQVMYNRERQQASPAAEYRGPPPSQSGEYGQYGAPQPPQHGVMEVMQRGPHPIPVNNMMAPPPHFQQQQPAQQQQPGLLSAGANQQQHMFAVLPLSVQQRLQTMVATGVISSIDEFGDKCYEVLAQLSEGLANEVLNRFTNANLTTVRNRSGFLIGVVKRVRQEFGFSN